jgi:hypothetical protein
MQEKKEQSRPVRVRRDVVDDLEQLAIEESRKRGKLLTIPEIVDEILRDAIKKRLQF